jgi:hypothetical protein
MRNAVAAALFFLASADRRRGTDVHPPYRLNWQTVLSAGYGDDRVLNERAELLRADRTLFVKVSYAFQQ